MFDNGSFFISCCGLVYLVHFVGRLLSSCIRTAGRFMTYRSFLASFVTVNEHESLFLMTFPEFNNIQEEHFLSGKRCL